MNYTDARSLIKSGDLLSFKPNDTKFLHVLTQAVTKSEYYHSGVAVWITVDRVRRLFICEATRVGRRLVPLSIYSTHKFDVTECPVQFQDMEESLLERVGYVGYGFMDFVSIGVRNLFGVTLRDSKGEVCSEMVQKEYKKAGFNCQEYPYSPGELKDTLNRLGFNDKLSVF